ncbi:hypothetical protein FHS00_001002 [Limimaricola variabilis]|uniref:Uncharacterized protein n=1 Tax=Limimaricola variabilis TaxID=1492771 RepID=A0ABR6HLW7_9RHOB|nr:hypothetical protein [Limimaricola variabilis]MBB3711440.1 hypothetical protein [Limimaricola variabilis]WPY93585.1 hypothetical protein T8T21_10720 [Limimaricola variabilis]
MTKHVIDRPKDRSAIRAREYARIEHEEAPHRAVRRVHARSLGARGAARLRQFLRIERGHEV